MIDIFESLVQQNDSPNRIPLPADLRQECAAHWKAGAVLDHRLTAEAILHIYVDADACPVKDEVYRVAQRYDVGVTLVAASWMRIPASPAGPAIVLEVVTEGFDAADDWIVARVTPDDLVITADIPLAARCIAAGAQVLGPTGRPFTEANIGEVLATRNLLAELRGAGMEVGGPAPFESRDRSRFLQVLDRTVQALSRRRD